MSRTPLRTLLLLISTGILSTFGVFAQQQSSFSMPFKIDSTRAARKSLVEQYKDFLVPENLIFQSADGSAKHYRISNNLTLATIEASASGRVFKSSAGATPSKLSGGLLWIQNQSSTGCTYGYRSWTKYNLSSINDASTISDVDQYVYCDSLKEGTFDYLNYDLYRVDNDPVSASATSLWDDISSGALYENDELVSNPPDWEWSDLNPPGDADLQGALVSDWFALGYMVDCSEDDATYFARFRGYDAAASYRPYLAITYTVNAPQPPTLSSPSDGSSNLSSPVTFRWRRSLGADSYRLQVARDNAFTDLVYNQGGITDTSRQVPLAIGTYYWHVNASNTLTGDYSNYRTIGVITSVEQIMHIHPESYSLSQNYPNPFNPTSTIEFSIPRQSRVKLIVFDLLGRDVATLADQEFPSGVFRTTWDGARAASGFYYYRLIAVPSDGAQPFVQTRKMILTK